MVHAYFQLYRHFSFRYLSSTSGSTSSNQRNVRFAEQVTSGGGSGGNTGNDDEEMMETDVSGDGKYIFRKTLGEGKKSRACLKNGIGFTVI